MRRLRQVCPDSRGGLLDSRLVHFFGADFGNRLIQNLIGMIFLMAHDASPMKLRISSCRRVRVRCSVTATPAADRSSMLAICGLE